jgi:hypothetical protein
VEIYEHLCSRRCPLANSPQLNSLLQTTPVSSRHGPLRKYRTSLLQFSCFLLSICCVRTPVVSFFVSRSLPKSIRYEYIAPSLRLFVSNRLPVYRHSFFSEGSAWDVRVWFHLSPRGSVCTVFTPQLSSFSLLSATSVPPFILFRGLCLGRPCLVSPISPWSRLHGVYSPTVPLLPPRGRLFRAASSLGASRSRCNTIIYLRSVPVGK